LRGNCIKRLSQNAVFKDGRLLYYDCHYYSTAILKSIYAYFFVKWSTDTFFPQVTQPVERSIEKL